MELKQRPVLWLPLLILALVFLMDKIAGLPQVLDRTLLWKKIEPPFYASREDLLAQARQETQPIGIILGSSRAGEFSSELFSQKSTVTRTYNFSAPLTCPAYYAYWLSRLTGNGIKPAFVLLEADTLLFSAGAMEYALGYSFDPGFVLRHTDLGGRSGSGFSVQGSGFTFDEAETFFLKYLFSLYRFPLDPKAIGENHREVLLPDGTYRTGRDLRAELVKLIERANRENFGGIPNPLQFQVAPEAMAADARRLANRHLKATSATQIIFFKQIIRELAEREIPTVVYWPLVSGPLYELELAYQPEFQQDLTRFLQNAKARYPRSQIAFLDPNPDPAITCRSFVDSSHLSGKCFDQVTELIVKRLPTLIQKP